MGMGALQHQLMEQQTRVVAVVERTVVELNQAVQA
jgi:hypothetical protein